MLTTADARVRTTPARTTPARTTPARTTPARTTGTDTVGRGLRRWVCCGSTMTGTGLEAFSALVPRDWDTEGGLRRMSDLGADPLRSVPRFRTVAPKGGASVELVGPAAVGEGHLDPASHVLASILPSLRPDARSLRVLDMGSPDHLPWPPHGFERSSAAAVTVAYLEDGTPWTEQLTLAVAHEQTARGEVSVALPALSVRAPAADHDAWLPLLDTIRRSFTVNPAWLSGGR